MARRVLLISINQCEDPYAVFPLGLAHLEGALRAAGHTTRWLDLRITGQDISSAVLDFQPDYVGISIRNIDDVLIRKREMFLGPLTSICPQLRQFTRAPIIIGGSGFSIFPKELLQLARADFGICGEGEESLVRLITALEAGEAYSDIPGLVYRDGEQIIINQKKARRGVAFESAVRPAHVTDYYLGHSAMLNLQTQRGCSHRCCYCTYPVIEGRTLRRRDPDEAAVEMLKLQASGAKYVFIVDSVFNSSHEHATAICEAFLRQGVKMQWGCFLRPQGLTPELMKLMKRAGLKHIEYGSDSFCDDVLAAYDKRLTFSDIQQSSELALREQIECCHFLICGGPGETEQTLEIGFENSKQLTGAVILALVGMRVYPNTALYERAVREKMFAPDTNFLSPQYYISPSLEEEHVFNILRHFSQRSANWIVGDTSPAYLKMAEQLRAKGVVGPLWTYFATMQRLLSFSTPTTSAASA